MEMQQEVPTRLKVGMKNWNRRWMVPALLACTTLSTNSYALLISQDSSFGTGTITMDSNTGLQWLDPWLAVTAGGGALNSFNDVKAEFGAGGLFEGYRYATRSEVNNLLFISAGIDANTSQSKATSTASDTQGVANIISFFDTTLEAGFIRILDAVFDDGTGGADSAILSYTQFGSSITGGTVTFFDSPNVSSNTNPYGHWLVRDNSASASSGGVPVDEPRNLALFGMALVAVMGLFRRNSQARINTAIA